MWPEVAYVGSATPKKQVFSILGARRSPKKQESSILGVMETPKNRESSVLGATGDS